MVAVDDRQSADAAADSGIGSTRLHRHSAAAMDVEQRGDDLEIVLHAVMNFAHQPSLALERPAGLAFRLLDLGDCSGKGVAKFLDLFAGPKPARQVERSFARSIGEHSALKPLQRTHYEPGDEQPGD